MIVCPSLRAFLPKTFYGLGSIYVRRLFAHSEVPRGEISREGRVFWSDFERGISELVRGFGVVKHDLRRQEAQFLYFPKLQSAF